MVSRGDIERTLRALNAAENNEQSSAADKSAAIDTLSAADVEGWANGAPRGGRAQEREQEAFIFSNFPDYHRDFEHVVIDPPMAAVTWRMRGSSDTLRVDLDLSGSSLMEFDEDARIKRFWMHFDDPLR